MSTQEPHSGDPDAGPRSPTDFVGARLLGLYDVRDRIASGGMGSVYLADDRTLDRKVVIKVPHARFLSDQTFRARFSREIGELVRLEHPHIVRIFAQGERNDVPFFVLQYLAGGSLEDRLEAANGPVAPSEVLTWARAIADTLDFIHERGTIHRDVKPGNILFDVQGNVYLSDFGVAKVLSVESVRLTEEHVLVGSPEHMAPEQGLGGELTPSVDQYALASMVYAALLGRPPFTGDSPIELMVQKNHDDPTPLADADPEASLVASEAIQRAMSRDPKERFPSCAAFVDTLEQAYETPVVVPVSPPPPPSRARLYVLLGLLAATLIWAWSRDSGDEGQLDPASLEALMGHYHADPPESVAEFRQYIERLTSSSDDASKRALEVVYADFIEGPGRDDPEARGALGYREFAYSLDFEPADGERRAYPYLRGVELAKRRRWFGAEEESLWQLALDAKRAAEAHRVILENDASLRATHALRLDVQQDEALSTAHFAWHWSAPYLLCMVSRDPLSRYDLLSIDDHQLAEQRAREINRRRADAQKALEAEARLLAPLHTTFLREFGDPLKLEELTAPYGGRPDLHPSKRRFPDGVPLLVLVFGNEGDMRRAAEIPPVVAADCHFVPSRGWLYLVGGSRAAVEAEPRTNKVLREAAHQLHFWFARQRLGWSHPAFTLNWFAMGVADWLAGLRIDLFRESATPGVNETRRQSLRAIARAMETSGSFTLYPLESLTAARSVLAPSIRGSHAPNPAVATVLAFDQSWALVHFLLFADDGRRRDGFLRYANEFGFAPSADADPRQAFEAAFGIETDADWDRWNEEFRTYVVEELLAE